MTTYTLTAELGTESETVAIRADDDRDATFTAIARIMELAYPNVALWARGAITLADSRGRVVRTMDAKD